MHISGIRIEREVVIYAAILANKIKCMSTSEWVKFEN
jgi:hypothetical protein